MNVALCCKIFLKEKEERKGGRLGEGRRKTRKARKKRK